MMAFAAELRASGQFSNISVTVEGVTLKLHMFPLLARSKYFQSLVSSEMADSTSITLHDLPGGLETMNLVADFCYDIDIVPRIGCENVGALVCAASYLQMTGTNNLLEVARKTLERLASKSALDCLQILKRCCTMPIRAEFEGVVELCASPLAGHYSYCWTSLLDEEASILKELPLKWMPSLLAKMDMFSERLMDIFMAIITWPPAAEERLLELTDASKVKSRSSLVYLLYDTDVPVLDDQLKCTTVFDAVLEYLPPRFFYYDDPVSSSICRWSCKALLFSSRHKLRSYNTLLQLCSIIESSLTVDECKDFPPDLMKSVNTQSCKSCFPDEHEKICSLNDEYLLLHCKKRSIRASEFLSVMRSVSKFRDPSSSFDRPFEAFEALLREGTVSRKEAEEISSTIDFGKLSNKCLQRAASNDQIPRDCVLSCIVQLCQEQRSELDSCASASQRLQNDNCSLEEENKTLKEQMEQMKRSSSKRKRHWRGRYD